MIRKLAGWLFFCVVFWHTLVGISPVVIGKRLVEATQMNCPKIKLRHGVGSDLKTYTIATDGCAEAHRRASYPTEVKQ